MGQFKTFLESGNTIGHHNDGPGSPFTPGGGGYLGSDQTGEEKGDTQHLLGHPPHLYNTDVMVPTVTKEGKITGIKYRQSPIIIELNGSPTLYVTLDEFNRIKKHNNLQGEHWNRLIGRTMKVLFQRHPDDKNPTLSQVWDVRIY